MKISTVCPVDYRIVFCFSRSVTDFSKKTGDYVSLSAVDLKLIALVYQLECELGPENGHNLRENPIQQPSRLEVWCSYTESCIYRRCVYMFMKNLTLHFRMCLRDYLLATFQDFTKDQFRFAIMCLIRDTQYKVVA